MITSFVCPLCDRNSALGAQTCFKKMEVGSLGRPRCMPVLPMTQLRKQRPHEHVRHGRRVDGEVLHCSPWRSSRQTDFFRKCSEGCKYRPRSIGSNTLASAGTRTGRRILGSFRVLFFFLTERRPTVTRSSHVRRACASPVESLTN